MRTVRDSVARKGYRGSSNIRRELNSRVRRREDFKEGLRHSLSVPQGLMEAFGEFGEVGWGFWSRHQGHMV